MAQRRTLQSAVQKQQSSEEKIKGNALYFLQDKDMHLDIEDAGSWARALSKLSDKEALAAIKEKASDPRRPKLAMVTIEANADGGDAPPHVRRHVDILLQENPDGGYDFTVPDVYKRDGPEEYEICGVILPAASFTKAVSDDWKTLYEARGIRALLARQSEINREIRKTIPSDSYITSLRKDQLPKIIKSIEELSERQAKMLADLDVPEEQLDQVRARLKLAISRQKEMEAELAEWDDTNDPFTRALEMNPNREESEKIDDAFASCFLEFAHKLAVEADLTTDAFEVWKEMATGEDYRNAMAVVTKGNDSAQIYAREATPISRDRARHLNDRTLN